MCLTPGRSAGKPRGGWEKDHIDRAAAESLLELQEEHVCPERSRGTVSP